MGPVWLDIPLDVQAAQVDVPSLRGYSPPDETPMGAGPAVAEVARLLAAAQRPLVLAGNGVRLAGGQDLLRRVVEESEAPLLLTWKAIDLVGHDHPLFFGCPGVMGSRTANFLVQNCDLLLVVGSRLDSSLTAFDAASFGRHAKRVVVDIDKAEVMKLGPVDVPLVMDAARFLRQLHEARQPARDRAEWLAYARESSRRYPAVLDEQRDCEEIDLYHFTEVLCEQLREDDVIVPESSGAAGEVTYQAMRVKEGQKVRNAAGLGAMGFGLPNAIGACIANGRARTVLVNGDGAFQLNVQELETVSRLRLPIKMFVLDNGGYASIRAMQRNQFEGRYVGASPQSGLTLPRLEGLAATYGLRFEEIAGTAGLGDAVARALLGTDPVLCRVVVRRGQATVPRVQAMRTAEGSMVSKPLEDMWPYLSPEELAENMIAERATVRGAAGEDS
jgi:acetolactate synthase-1/2/3 large subunit